MRILMEHVSCMCTPDELQAAIDAGYKKIYIQTLKGVILHHRLRGERFIQLKCDSIPGYTETPVEENIRFLPAGKVPIELWNQVVQFFKEVMRVKKSEVEAMIWILWSADKGYFLHVPTQRISKASVSYDWSSIPEGASIIVDIHSHNTMSAFFSGTDNADDRSNISFSGVLGKINDAVPMTVWRFNYLDRKYDATFDTIFLAPEVEAPAIPEEWLAKVETQSWGNYGNAGNQGSRGGRADHLHGYRFQPGGNGYQGGNSHQSVTQGSQGGSQGGEGSSPSNPAKWTARTPSVGVTSQPGPQSASFDFGYDYGENEGFGGYSAFHGMHVEPEPGRATDSVVEHPKGMIVSNIIDGEEKKFIAGEGGLLIPFDEAVAGTDFAEMLSDPEQQRKFEQWLERRYNGEELLAGNAEVGVTREARGSVLTDDEVADNSAYQVMFDDIANQYGQDAANAYMEMDENLAFILDHDELLERMAGEMFQGMSFKAQERFFADIFNNLPPALKEKIQTYGIN